MTLISFTSSSRDASGMGFDPAVGPSIAPFPREKDGQWVLEEKEKVAKKYLEDLTQTIMDFNRDIPSIERDYKRDQEQFVKEQRRPTRWGRKSLICFACMDLFLLVVSTPAVVHRKAGPIEIVTFVTSIVSPVGVCVEDSVAVCRFREKMRKSFIPSRRPWETIGKALDLSDISLSNVIKTCRRLFPTNTRAAVETSIQARWVEIKSQRLEMISALMNRDIANIVSEFLDNRHRLSEEEIRKIKEMGKTEDERKVEHRIEIHP